MPSSIQDAVMTMSPTLRYNSFVMMRSWHAQCILSTAGIVMCYVGDAPVSVRLIALNPTVVQVTATLWSCTATQAPLWRGSHTRQCSTRPMPRTSRARRSPTTAHGSLLTAATARCVGECLVCLPHVLCDAWLRHTGLSE